MKTNLFFIAAATLMITSCSKESIVDSDVNKATNAITFTSYTNVTKGNPVDDNSEFQAVGKTFGVSAFVSDQPEGAYMGTETKGVQIKWDGAWIHADAGDARYWPTGGQTLDFYAHSPFEAADAITKTAFNNETGLTIDYTVAAAEAGQVDLMFAEAIGVSKPTDKTSVELPFRHALTQIHFGIATAVDNLFIKVAANGIAINRVMSKGTFAAKDAVWSNWAMPTLFTVTSAEMEAGYRVNAETKYKTVGSDDEALMLLPQKFEATTLDGKEAGTEGSYLTINCRIYQMLSDGKTKSYLHGKDDYATINVPISSARVVEGAETEVWAINNKVTYNLLIGAGSSTGFEYITFTTAVEEWVPVDGGIVENK